ncbi:MAG: ABC transporter permease [Treponema sp.]
MTILTLLGISAGLACILTIGGYYEYNYWGLRESFIRSQYGHIQISRKGYYENQNANPLDYTIDNTDKIIRYLETVPEVEVISPRLQFTGLLDTSAGKSALVLVRGIIPERENEFNTFFSKKKGLDLKNTDLSSAELGSVLADVMKLNTEDIFYLSVIDAFGSQNAQQFSVKSEIGSYSADFDAKIVRIPLETARTLCSVDGVHEIALIISKTELSDKVKAKIEHALSAVNPDLVITTWETHAGYYSQVVRFYGGYFSIVLFIVIIVVFFSTFNTQIMSINERMKEIGTMESVGASKTYIGKMFLSEGGIISVLGIFAGIVAAVIIASAIRIAGGIKIPPPPGISTMIFVQIRFTIKNLLIACIVGAAVPLTAVSFAMLRVLKTPTVELLR